MPLLTGDIRFARSANMADVPEGGGPPSAQLLTSGRSNEIFPDISEETRTVGRVEIYQIFSVLRNTDRTPFLGSNTILAEPPADPNVSITLLSLGNPFATRADIARRIESGMSPGPEWAGYLLENHYQTMRSVSLLQRPGMSPPTIGRTYLLVYNEGLPGERRQRIRIKTADTEVRTFTEIVNNTLIDFQAQVTTCELFDGLIFDYPGSPPMRSYARQLNKTVMRETVYSDSGMFCGASRLTAATAINDVWLQVASIYTQIVPNSRTEVAVVDRRPASRQTLVLATAPRRVEVGVTPHTQRIKIREENAGMIYVAQLKPPPEPGTLFIDFWALGQRYTLMDDGTGRITGGQGSGSVNHITGALQMTLKSVPDVGSSITLSHGTRLGYDNRSGQAGFRAPEYALKLEHTGIKPGTLVATWMSGGVLRAASANASGVVSGAASGEFNGASGTLYIRPKYMPDAGAQFSFEYEWSTVVTKSASVTPDAGGFASIALDTVPAAGSVTVRWITVNDVTASGGATTGGSASSKGGNSKSTTVWEPNPDYVAPIQPATPGIDISGIPVSITRVPVNGSAYTPHMAAGGTRTGTGGPVYISVKAEDNPGGPMTYPVPNVSGVAWTEEEYLEGKKVIGGVTYLRWAEPSYTNYSQAG